MNKLRYKRINNNKRVDIYKKLRVNNVLDTN